MNDDGRAEAGPSLIRCCVLAQSKPKKKTKGAADDGLGLAAVGTEKGTILLWNLRSGELVHRLGEAKGAGSHSMRVTGVCFHPSAPLLYSCGEDKLVIEWNIETGDIVQYETKPPGVGCSPRAWRTPVSCAVVCAFV